MNWITKLINDKVPENVDKKDIPDNLWVKCPSCNTLLFKKDLEANLYVCTSCDFHLFLPVKVRLNSLFDKSEFLGIKLPTGLEDPLKFKDKVKYTERLKTYREKSDSNDAIIAGYGKINNNHCIVAVMDFTFMGGSMGTAVGEGIAEAAMQAINKKIPFIIVSASGGARMQEGMFSLMQMAKTTVAVEKLKEAKLPYIVVLTDQTMGGVTASFAMLGDIHIAEKKARIGFAGARVIEQTIRQTLPEGFQTAEYLLDKGMVDVVVHRHQLKETLGKVLGILSNK